MQSEKAQSKDSMMGSSVQPADYEPVQEIEYFVEKKHKLASNQLLFFMAVAAIALLAMAVIQNITSSDRKVRPIHIGIPWSQTLTMDANTSRVFQLQFFSGHDRREQDPYIGVTQRQIQWVITDIPAKNNASIQTNNSNKQSSSQCTRNEIISVDLYGRVNAVKVGSCRLVVNSLSNIGVSNYIDIHVVSSRPRPILLPKIIINYKGQPAKLVHNLQKIVNRYTQAQIQARQTGETVPNSVISASSNPKADPSQFQKQFQEGQIVWKIVDFADKSPGRYYITRENITQDSANRDKLQYFIGDRYLPENGANPVMIESDGINGIWIVGGEKGDVTHVHMVELSYRDKALRMSEESEKCISRYGLMANAQWKDGKCVPAITDNDGLWTSLYGVGELMKYSVFKRQGQSQEMILQARRSALKALKAVLMIAQVTGRSGTVQARIRTLNNTLIGQGAFYTHQFLKQGKQMILDTYPGRLSDGISFYGIDVGKKRSGYKVSGKYRYSMLPIYNEDWTTDLSERGARTERSLGGFFSRSFAIPALGQKTSGGLWFRRNQNGSTTVASGAQGLYDFQKGQQPVLQLGNEDIPEAIRDVIKIDGLQYNKSDLAYKGDTSTDSIIAHLFLYKVAYDILDPNDPEQRALIQLVQKTMVDFCQHLLNNGYNMVDATGQATKWVKLSHQLFSSDYCMEDSPLKTIQLLLAFKVAHYVTSDPRWKQQYDFLTESKQDYRERGYGYDFLDNVGTLWDRWLLALTADGNLQNGPYALDWQANPTKVEVQRHMLVNTHFSDEEEAFLSLYLAFQLQQDPNKLRHYRKNMEGYWKSVSHSQNPLWYFICQLSKPNQHNSTDAFSKSILQTASWSLSRHPIDTRQFQAYIKGSRPDTIHDNILSVDPALKIGARRSTKDADYIKKINPQNTKIDPSFDPYEIYQIKVLPPDERSVHKFNQATFVQIDSNHNPTNMEAATLYTLPYWLGVYHKMLAY